MKAELALLLKNLILYIEGKEHNLVSGYSFGHV